MSLLKKLNRTKNRVFNMPKKKEPITKEAIDEVNKQLQADQYNAVFRLSGATFSLWQRLASGIDQITSMLKLTGVPMTNQDAYMITLAEAALKSMGALDEHIRTSYIIMEDGVSGMDDVHSKMNDILSKMELVSINSLDVLEKVIDTMLNSNRYIWIDNEETYKDNMHVAIQYGIDLAKEGRKKANGNDVDKFLLKHTTQNENRN